MFHTNLSNTEPATSLQRGGVGGHQATDIQEAITPAGRVDIGRCPGGSKGNLDSPGPIQRGSSPMPVNSR